MEYLLSILYSILSLICALFRAILVELRGIEPLSESNLTGLSPGAVCYLHSLGAAGTDTLRTLVAS